MRRALELLRLASLEYRHPTLGIHEGVLYLQIVDRGTAYPYLFDGPDDLDDEPDRAWEAIRALHLARPKDAACP